MVHGLRSGTKAELRKRDRRTERLLRIYLQARALDGRPIASTSTPLARRFVELEALARDQYTAATNNPANLKLADSYRSTVRAQAVVATALGEGAPRSKETTRWEQAQRERQEIADWRRRLSLKERN